MIMAFLLEAVDVYVPLSKHNDVNGFVCPSVRPSVYLPSIHMRIYMYLV